MMSAPTFQQTSETSRSSNDAALLADCKMLDTEVSALINNRKLLESQVANLKIADTPFTFTACFFSFNQTNTYSPFCHLTLTGDIEATCCDTTDKARFDTLWPKNLLEAPRISINVYLQDSKPSNRRHPSDFFAVYHFFASLAGFLSGSGLREQKVKIKFLATDAPVEKMLHPNILASLDGFLVKPEVEPKWLWIPRHAAAEGAEE